MSGPNIQNIPIKSKEGAKIRRRIIVSHAMPFDFRGMEMQIMKDHEQMENRAPFHTMTLDRAESVMNSYRRIFGWKETKEDHT